MDNWYPYLKSIFPLAEAEALKESQRLMTFQSVLRQEFSPEDRRALLRSVSELDTASQVFLLPEVVGQLPHISLPARRYTFEMIANLLDGDCDRIIELAQLAFSGKNRSEDLIALANEIAEELSQLNPSVDFASFEELPGQKGLVLSLSLLEAISIFSQNLEDEELITFWNSDDAKPFRESMIARLGLENKGKKTRSDRANFFVRRLIIHWLGRSNVALESISTSDFLKSVYEKDLNPLVAETALLELIESAPESDLEKLTNYIMAELRQFKRRTRSTEKGRRFPDVVVDLSCSLIQAMGRLAEIHYPNATPMNALNKFIDTSLTNQLDYEKGNRSTTQISWSLKSKQRKLLNVFTPRIRALDSEYLPKVNDQRRWRKITRELDDRADWVKAGFSAVAGVVAKALEVGHEPDQTFCFYSRCLIGCVDTALVINRAANRSAQGQPQSFSERWSET